MTTKVTSSVLANTGVVADTYGSASLVPIITIDAQGRITSATAATVSGAGAGVGATTYTQTKFTATSGQTVFNVNYTVGYVQVFLNGVLLDSLTEFTASNGTSITLSQAAALNDIITVYAYSVNTIANIAGGAAGTVIYQSAANTTSNTDVGTTGHLLTSAGAGKPYWTAQTALSIANTQITGLITAPQIAPSAIPAGGFSNMQVFTSPGTFNIPPSTTKLKVTVVGGGAGTPGGFRTFITAAAGTGASGSPSSFGAYQTATGGSVTTAGTAPGADLILDGQSLGRYGSSGNTALNQGFTGPNNGCSLITYVTNALTAGSNIYNLNPFAGKGGYGVKIISAPFPVTTVPVTVGIGGGGGGGGGSRSGSCVVGTAGSSASGVYGGAGGNGGNASGTALVGAGGGGGGGAGGFCVGAGGAAGARGTGSPSAPVTTLATAGQPGAGTVNKLGGGSGGNGGWQNCSCSFLANGGAGGGSGGHSGIVIVEF